MQQLDRQKMYCYNKRIILKDPILVVKIKQKRNQIFLIKSNLKLKKATSVNKSVFARKVDLAHLKSNVGKVKLGQ